MSHRKDLVRVELTYHKVLATNRYKKRAESRRQPAPSAGEWPRQPASTTRPTRRQTPVRRPPPCQEKETSPPAVRTLPDTPRQHIIHHRTKETGTIQPSPVISRSPATSTSPVNPPKKKTRTQSSTAPASKKKNRTHCDSYDFSYTLHEKYDLQEFSKVTMMNSDAVIVTASVSSAQMWQSA